MIEKVCGCCSRGYSLEDFLALPAPEGGETQDDGVECLLYRNCACNSTMAIVIFAHVAGKEILIAEAEKEAA